MKLYFINDDEETMMIDLIRYERSKTIEENGTIGVSHIQDVFKLYVENIPNILKSFIKKSYDIHVYILFDDDMEGRVKKFFSPSISITDRYIKIEKLISYDF